MRVLGLLGGALRAGAALVVLGLLAAAVPWALLRWSEWPITGLPSGAQLRDAPSVMLSDQVLLDTLVVGLWVCWGIFVVAVLVEVVVQARGAWWTHRVGLVQRLASFLVGSLTVGLTSPVTAAPALPGAAVAELPQPQDDLRASLPPDAFPALVALQSYGAQSLQAEPEDETEEPPPATFTGEVPTPPTTAAAQDEPAQDEEAPLTITVDHGDTPWSLAETHLSDGIRWREIWELNRAIQQPDGSVWSEASMPIQPGWLLRLPGPRTVTPPSQVTGQDAGERATEVRVVPGNHFWGIAKSQLTAAWGRTPSNAEIIPYWTLLVETNRPRLLPPSDPDLIHPGQVFILPPLPPDPLAPAGAPTVPQDRGAGDEAPPEASDEASHEPGSEEETPALPEDPVGDPSSEEGSSADERVPADEQASDDQPSEYEGSPEQLGEDGINVDEEVSGEASGELPDGETPVESGAEEPESSTADGSGAEEPESSTADGSGAEEPESSTADGSGAEQTDEESGNSRVPVGLLGGGVALAGVGFLVERRRRSQQRHRRSGRRIARPEVERELRHGADLDGTELLDAALRAAAAGSGTTGLPQVRWVERAPHQVVLALEESSPAPPGFVAVAGNRWVSRGGLHDLTVMGSSASAPVPTLLPVGTATEGNEVLVELESSVVLTVSGPTEESHGLVRALAVAAATAPWSEDTQVLLVGMGGELTELPWVRSVDRLEDAVAEAEAYADRTMAALRSIQCTTTAQARAAGFRPETWNPLIVLSVLPPEDPAIEERLQALAIRSHSAVGLVVPPARPGVGVGRHLTIHRDGSLTIQGVDVDLWPRLLSEHEAEGVVVLLDGASRLEDVAPGGRPATTDDEVRRPKVVSPLAALPDRGESAEAGELIDVGNPVEVEPITLTPVEIPPVTDLLDGSPDADNLRRPLPTHPTTEAGGPGDADGGREVASAPPSGDGAGGRVPEHLADVDVLVRVLGEVEAVRYEGSADGRVEEELTPVRQKSLEAITYLALRETAVDREDLESRLFPDGANAAKTVYNTVSSARAMLGDELFPPSTGGRYELSPRVVTDYGLFCELVAQAEEAGDDATAADLLTDALGLVRGEPFIGVGRGYAWVGPHRGMIVAQIVDAAEGLAEVRLDQGDWRAAEWAARQGLRAFPTDERMYRSLMRAARAAGNIPGVQRVFQELCQAVADPDLGVEPEDSLHPETIALLEELTGVSPRAGRRGA